MRIIRIAAFLIIVAHLLLPRTALLAQTNLKEVTFHAPVDIPMYLSGNFGEIRSTHFHTGIDIKTQGKTGFKIYSIDEGYISRIKIQAGGYGNAIYITHPNGYTSVYGHLKSFRDDLQSYTLNSQYSKSKFEINLFPPKDKFRVKKGEWFALSGNSGRSGGPHLHFEIRDTRSEHPLNPLLFNFDIKDNIQPKIHRLAVYPMQEDSRVNGLKQEIFFKPSKSIGTYVFPQDDTIQVWGEIGFGISANDYLNGSSNRCGLYTIELWIDSTKVYESRLDELDFGELRNVVSHIDYKTKRKKGITIQKSFIDPNNQLSIYSDLPANSSAMFREDEKVSDILYVLKDAHGNKTEFSFHVKTAKPELHSMISQRNIYVQAMPYIQSNLFVAEGIEILFPEKCFFSDLFFNYTKSDDKQGFYSPVHHVHNESTPLLKYYEIQLKADSLPDYLKQKALLAYVDTSGGNNRISSMGGSLKNDVLKARIRDFGSFAICVDTIAPEIKPLNIFNGKRMNKLDKISFKISDDLSGIKSYSATIDGSWVLFRHDAKKDHIYYLFSDHKIDRGIEHHIVLEVTDEKNNQSHYNGKFWW
jgi:hypothetical protein